MDLFIHFLVECFVFKLDCIYLSIVHVFMDWFLYVFIYILLRLLNGLIHWWTVWLINHHEEKRWKSMRWAENRWEQKLNDDKLLLRRPPKTKKSSCLRCGQVVSAASASRLSRSSQGKEKRRSAKKQRKLDEWDDFLQKTWLNVAAMQARVVRKAGDNWRCEFESYDEQLSSVFAESDSLPCDTSRVLESFTNRGRFDFALA